MKKNNYIPSITGLRGIAVLAVLIYHSNTSFFPGGFLGVDVFFVISGFLIGKVIYTEISNGVFSIRKFYLKRIRRIIPALLFTIFISFILVLIFYHPNDIYEFQQSVPWVISFTSNLFFWKTTNYFSSDIYIKPLAHTWSLGVEEQFYILLPLIFLAIKNKKSRNFIFIFLLIVSFIYGFGENYYGLPFGCPNSDCISTTNFYWLHTRLWELLFGVVLNFLPQISKSYSKHISVVSFISILTSFILYSEEYIHPGLYTLIPVVSTCLLIYFHEDNNVVNLYLSKGFIYYLGRISYSLYLVHYPIYAIFKYYYIEFTLPFIGNIEFFVAFLISFIVAIFSYKIVETPFRNMTFMKNSSFLLLLIFISSIFVYLSTIPINGLNKNTLPEDIVIQNTGGRSEVNRCMIEGPDVKYDFEYCQKDYNETIYNVLVIGDSTSQNLAYGLIEQKYPNTSVSYWGVTGCLPLITNYEKDQPNFGESKCTNNYEEIISFINSSQFDLVVISYNFNMLKILDDELELSEKSMKLFFDSTLRLNRSNLLIFGNPINWEDSLPRIITKMNLFNNELNEYNGTFLVDHLFETDRLMKTYSKDYGVNYFSVIDNLCNNEKCPIYKKINGERHLASVDSLHYSTEFAKYYGSLIGENYILEYDK